MLAARTPETFVPGNTPCVRPILSTPCTKPLMWSTLDERGVVEQELIPAGPAMSVSPAGAPIACRHRAADEAVVAGLAEDFAGGAAGADEAVVAGAEMHAAANAAGIGVVCPPRLRQSFRVRCRQ